MRSKLVNIALAVISLLLVGGILEVALRAFSFVEQRGQEPRRTLAEDLGWATGAHVQRVYRPEGYGEVTYTTVRDGFRIFGDVATEKVKIFVIGDSFTAAETVSDGKAYYHEIARGYGGTEIFAYGCGGYGSLQEAMVLDRHIDEIRPDLVLWQFHTNDVINNLHALESQSLYNNNQMTRPYLEDGRVVWRFPRQYRGPLGRLVQSSHLLRLIHVRKNLLIANRLGSIEDELEPGHPLLERSRKTTEEIMARVKRRLGTIPLVAFLADDAPPWHTVFREISARCAIPYFSGVPPAVEAARQAGQQMDGMPHDTHWNAAGHLIAGRALVEFLVAGGHPVARESEPGSPLELLAREAPAIDPAELSVTTLDRVETRGFDALEGPYPQWDMPRAVRWMVSRHAEIRFRPTPPASGLHVLRLRLQTFASPQKVSVAVNREAPEPLDLPDHQWTTWRSRPVHLLPGENVVRIEASAFDRPEKSSRRLFVLFDELRLVPW